MRTGLAVWFCAAVIISHGEPTAAQADAHARAVARASCESGKHSEAVVDATAAVEREPDESGPRMRLADALVDQGCYQEAAEVLEAAQESHPREIELSAKLRAVRSLVTEQTYIEGLTQAAESAKFARNQLRCTRLADITACEDALKSKPDEEPLWLAKGDALLQANRVAEATAAYHHASQLKPGDEAIKTKLSAAEALQAKLQPTPAPAGVASITPSNTAPRPKAAKRPPSANTATAAAAGQHPAAAPVVSIAALAPAESKVYSNDAPPGQTN
jgi:cytochrome c-type biogenesis protein CcmH/NrfG